MPRMPRLKCDQNDSMLFVVASPSAHCHLAVINRLMFKLPLHSVINAALVGVDASALLDTGTNERQHGGGVGMLTDKHSDTAHTLIPFQDTYNSYLLAETRCRAAIQLRREVCFINFDIATEQLHVELHYIS